MPRKTIDLDDEAAKIYDSWSWKDKSRNVSEAIKMYEQSREKEDDSIDEKIERAIRKHEEQYHTTKK